MSFSAAPSARRVHRTPSAALGALALLAGPAAAQCELGVLESAHPQEYAFFGLSVAVDGGTAAVGESSQVGFEDVVSQVAVFERAGAGWMRTVELEASDAVAGDGFGRALDLDGDRVLVGAPAQPGGGAAYVFERVGGTWMQTARLAGSGLGSDFGDAVALDGDVAVVGDATDDALGQLAGAVHVFEFDGASWIERDILRAADGQEEDFFGTAVAIADGYIVVGAPGESAAGPNAGAVYVFEHTTAGWVEVAKLQADGAQPSDSLGTSVAIAGNDLFAGAPGVDVNGTSIGAVLRYEQTIHGWVQTHALLPRSLVPNGRFGDAVAVSGDRLLVGARDALLTGAAYAFVREGASWVERARLQSANPVPNGDFGFAVALAGDDAIVGAPAEDGPVQGAGVAYAYDLASLPTGYCIGAPNSAGAGARIGSSGPVSLAANGFALRGEGAIPGQFGLFFYGPNATQVPFGDGFRCVGGTTFRLGPPSTANGVGTVVKAVDFDLPPAGSGPGEIAPGELVNFQLWYRDPFLTGGSGFNFSDALAVVFCP